MKLYLMRHGEAIAPEINPECPLTEKGKSEVQQLANFLAPAGILVSHVYHSEKLRAKQTARIMATTIALGQDVRTMRGLNPNDPIAIIADEINGWVDDTVIVGHMPFLAKLVGDLVAKEENQLLIDFQPATLVCLQRISRGSWCINWVLRPDILTNSHNSHIGFAL